MIGDQRPLECRADRPMPSWGAASRRDPVDPGRRTVLLAAAGLITTGIAACGPVRVGGPAPFTPPPEGIDDLYRREILDALERCLSGVAAAEDLDAADPELSSLLTTGLDQQRLALLTGAEAEDEASAGTTQAPGASDSGGEGASSTAPADASVVVTELVALRDLTALAARQISGSLARPVAGIGSWAAWAARRTTILLPGTVASWTAPPVAEDITATRDVPSSDPPSVGARSDFETTLETAQADEWYAGYVFEVLAAQSEGRTREQHSAASAVHRSRAEVLAGIAEEEGIPVVTRQASYPLPTSFGDDAGKEAWPAEIGGQLLIVHLALVGASPFARRSEPIAAALAEGDALASLVPALDPLPSFEDE